MASASGVDEGSRPSLPVVIVPGIICSALRVEQSSICPEWEGQRIFAPSVGKVASCLKRKGTWHESEEGRLQNALLQHFVTKTPTEEVDGVRVRAIEGGLNGLNLFDAGVQPNIEATGFRQGNLYAGVIKALKAVGYAEGSGLECAAYDWRMAPGVLESRDGFFKRMKEQVERMNEQSQDRRGVVLMGHSMGNKVVQYFLNYIMASSDGQAWVDRHIYSWLLVGAPLLGAAYCGRMAVSGDCPYPGLDQVFSKHELVILYRSLGSLPWLFPIGAHETHLFYVRREGALEIRSMQASVAGYGFSAGNRVKLLVEVFWGRGRGHSSSLVSKSSSTFDGEVAAFDEEENFMRFGGPEELPRDATITVTVAEKGLDDGKTLCACGGPCCICLAPCALCRAACLAGLRGARCTGQCWRAMRSSARGEEDLGMPRAATASRRLSRKLRGGGLVTLRLPLRRSLFSPCASGEVVLQLRWLGAEQLWREWGGPGAEALPSRPGSKAGASGCFAGLFPCLRPSRPAAPEVPIRHRRRPRSETYDKIPLPLMLRMLRCERALQCWEDFYKGDPLYNDAGTDDVPPVRRVVAVSGCDVRTEIGCVLRLNTHRASDKTNVRTRFVPDDEAELTPGGSLAVAQCSISAGALYEEPGGERQAGDGTVPFCSLHHSSTWAGKLQYEEHLLSKSSHSVNMVDPRFHKLLMKVLTPAAPQSEPGVDIADIVLG